MKKKINLGFTLIEILVTISVIGILAALALVSFGGAQKQARDTQRKSDLKQYQTALEQFSNKNNGFYPARSDGSGVSFVSIICPLISLDNCSDDPKNGSDPTFTYRYQSDSDTSGSIIATKYVLWIKIENSTDYWVVCSNGRVGTKAQTGFSVTGGACPL